MTELTSGRRPARTGALVTSGRWRGCGEALPHVRLTNAGRGCGGKSLNIHTSQPCEEMRAHAAGRAGGSVSEAPFILAAAHCQHRGETDGRELPAAARLALTLSRSRASGPPYW